mmetsp:Transcript_6186/g.9498  ORF Transcript_6186/g.9498 Transcript_6186/m.9498 type:complete len:348 (+) Transcript_6186:121-1164(+)|eukprot:CAMPEP_0178894652 /NCGR_PEP_ID=MMETSP0786-20121207/136_1 /TAXON_ID=186022 /ORGANISM="Thalassionema frauenfeldii, Strain CCMP 1798" /LENGTH=347 /DNA_ID=CAMNT_0020564767 /DNA_START=31 /DNA_END=1074 /DNA_ORIENTATION=+
MKNISFWCFIVATVGTCHALASIRAAVYQSPPPVATDNPLSILIQATDALNVASKHGVQLVLFPELFLSDPLDRESQPLNIIGNVCSELNIACVIGYCEKRHESEKKAGIEDQSNYNSLAAFNADGTRAGNYRSSAITPEQPFLPSHPFVELMPLKLQLPTSETPQELRVGMLLGNDILTPESCRHLTRSGSELLLVAASMQEENIVKQVVQTRAFENKVPLLFSNYVGKSEKSVCDQDKIAVPTWIGSSAIISEAGKELVGAPCEVGGDMPNDEGYLLLCDSGELYAADIEISPQKGRNKSVEESLKHWMLEVKPLGNTGKREKKGFRKDIFLTKETRRKAKTRRK